MADSALNEAERTFLAALNELGVPFLVIGMSAALIEGATGSTQKIDLWFGMAPPAVGGGELGDRFDIVTHADGLGDFEAEYAGAKRYTIDGVPLRVLPLERVIVSKRASNRAKDVAALPLLEEALRAREGSEPNR